MSRALSVVLVADRLETLEPVIACFRAQDERGALELILVLPQSAPDVDIDPSLDGFGAVKVVTIDTIVPLARGRAAGVRAATAPLVFLGETHSFPAPGFVREILLAHEPPWAVVVPGFGNANAKRLLSWVGFVSDYGQWLHDLPSRELETIPTYNAVYNREDLLAYDQRLETLLSPSDELVRNLRADGLRFRFAPSARLDHLNVDIGLRVWLGERFLAAADMAHSRSKPWSRARRAAYVLGSPLIPLVLLRRLRPGVAAMRRQRRLRLGFYGLLVLGALVQSAGEVVGYSVGLRGENPRRVTEFEVHKSRYATGPS